ncbi:carbohydrate ABC transporter permease [Paenibacillus chungangensis]|uniref:Carbohydrate ABC transporter permease n=1 Tax=Paenibacillus chungangensis TaxID=696535 RepID=A0ABW3HL62_9BACL
MRKRVSTTLLYIFLFSYSLLSIYPIIWMILYSFKNNEEIFVTNPFGIPKEFRIENYVRAWTEYDILTYFMNSVIVTLSVVGLTLIISLMFAYATARMKWKLSNAAKIYVVAGLFIPVQIILIPLLILVRDAGLSNSWLSLIVPYTAFQISFSSFVINGFFRSIPNDLEESAAIDGAGIYTIFLRIMVPIVSPAVATVAIFVFLHSWNEFTMALILISEQSLKTLPLGLLSFQGQFNTDWGAMGAALTIASVPTVIMYVLFSERVERALSVGGAVK